MPFQGASQQFLCCFPRIPASKHDDIQTVQLMPPQSETLPYRALDTIPGNGPGDLLFGNGQPQTWMLQVIVDGQNGKKFIRCPDRIDEYPFVIGRPD